MIEYYNQLNEYSRVNYYFVEYDNAVEDHQRNLSKFQELWEYLLSLFNYKLKFYKDLEARLYKEFGLKFDEAVNLLSKYY